MALCIFSAKPSFADVVKSALKTSKVMEFANTAELLGELVRKVGSKCSLVVLDLDGPDAIRLLSFIKSSPQLHQVPIVTVGTDKSYASVEPEIRKRIDAALPTPVTATELAAVVASIREGLDPDPDF